MAELSTAEKVKLVEQFDPVLLLHPNEQFYPVDPKRYLESAALWRAAAEDGIEPAPLVVDLNQKSLWGKRPRGKAATFPRKPSVERGLLRGLASEQIAGKVWLGAKADPDTSPAGELPSVPHPFQDAPGLLSDVWLDPNGWLESEDVTETSINKKANLPKLQQQWDDTNPANPLKNGRFWYTAEVIDQSLIALLLRATASTLQDDRGKLLNDLVASLDGFEDVQLIVYYLFYPAHQDVLRKKDAPPTDPPKEIRNYGGDWTSVVVLAARDKPLLPINLPGPWQGKLIGVTRRKFEFFEISSALRHDLDVRLWSDSALTLLKGTHPVIFASQGSHSHYLTPGDHEALAPAPPDGVIDSFNQGIDATKKAIDDANDAIDGLDTSRDIVVLLAKVAAGASLFGVFGAAVGLVAGLIEAATTSLPSVSADLPDKIDPDQFKGSEPGPAATPAGSTAVGIGKALLPVGVSLTDPLSGKLATDHMTLLAQESQTWQCASLTDAEGVLTDLEAENRRFFQLMERIRSTTVADNQTWWPAKTGIGADKPNDPGFRGRWGVRVTDDLSGAGSGMVWVDYAAALIVKLITPSPAGNAAPSP